jgi:ABC-2 type transport system permease protein
VNPQRLRGLIRKEFLQILRDPSAVAIAFFLPVFLLFLFGYGVTLDARRIPLAIVVNRPTSETSAFVGGLQQSFYFHPEIVPSIQEAERAVMDRRADGVLWLRSNFRGMRKTRFRGLDRVDLHFSLVATAYNVMRMSRLGVA